VPGAAMTEGGGPSIMPGSADKQKPLRMLYLILGKDGPDSLAGRALHRPAHLQRLRSLGAEGRLVLAGPLPAIDAADPGPAGYRGSLIVAEFSDFEAARQWADADPYLLGGVYASVDVSPFVRVLP